MQYRSRLNSRQRLLSLSLGIVLALGAGAAGRESLVGRSDSPTSVTAYATTEKPGYLGFSAYPANTTGKAYHTIIPVKAGSWQERLSLSSSFAGGTYELALWDRQVSRAQCRTSGCKWCPVNGYHMDGLRSYTYGKVGR
jgi:hypothetical protein